VNVWIDAQLSPALAAWMTAELGVRAQPLRDLGLRDATDSKIFFAARDESAIVLTKDADFVRLLEQHGAPPQVIWLTVGNSSNDRLCSILSIHWPRVDALIAAGEPLIEIEDAK
jgi:predicted nuclease of predicted toxin-antitoxin system